jgi:molybdate transport system substrate-binding protein
MRTLTVLLGALLLAGCAGEDSSGEELLVSAAASLTDVFGEMKDAFEADNPGVRVVLNLAGSATLRHQILEGAPVEVFASADLSNMGQVVASGDILGEPENFATNQLQIAVPSGNPAGISGIEDLADEDLLIGLCAPGVPCGDYAYQALNKAGVTPAADTHEPDVKFLIAKIEAGELDAGISFVTDVAASGGSVEGIEIPIEVNVVAEYPIAVLANASSPALAGAFVDFVLSERGQSILADHGFGAP